MARTFAISYNFIHQYRARLIGIFLVGSMILVCLYGLSVYMVIARTVAFQQTQARVSQINTVVANLDARYIAVSSAITPDVLGTYGLREGAPAFIHRYSSTKGNIGRVAAFGHEL
ncbi:MAG: hypothetical protein A3B11_01130 [Candidatus Taylorbacteria bacterium RIFCSPLOWO2_01_FULL_44_26]|uniref:Uncharacterized protein n=2 Tax=Candidatus Tayloriibacteriota TaxID=1817919 RepID=A0A1G2MIX5_9BACT|nr:MAG: hypothetical protein A3D50_00910 [Candidatus Taylorbacteria bacterium RIFCSPHIGHO2_02_FULL_44_12]OHA30704.1 MAG: hypothetical protein A3B11_01130 [Candidatus Taylorbacteria bacterium RIFCSPLOWO2_01_FULL_44_26]